MQTRSGLVHLLDGSVVKLHYRPYRRLMAGYDRYRYTTDAEVTTTTKKILIARVLDENKKSSPWFEILDDEPDTITRLIEWWVSGSAISSIMLR